MASGILIGPPSLAPRSLEAQKGLCVRGDSGNRVSPSNGAGREYAPVGRGDTGTATWSPRWPCEVQGFRAP